MIPLASILGVILGPAALAQVPGPVASIKPAWVVEVEGQDGDLGETPMVVGVPTEVRPGEYRLKSKTVPAKNDAPALVFVDGGRTHLATVLPGVPARARESYELIPGPSPIEDRVEIRPGDAKNLDVRVGGKPWTTYRTDVGPKPFYDPLIGPTGVAMTRSFPMRAVAGETKDHPHQRSLWFTHGSVNGVDFWSEVPNHGSIRETSRPAVVSGPGFGMIRTTDDWVGPDGKLIARDERVARFFSTRSGRALDIDVNVMATEGPVTFGDTKEGTLGLRVATSMDVDRKQGGRILNAEGLKDGAAWGKPSPWVDYSGVVDGSRVGIAVLNHPDSFRHPTTWHVRTYGLFASNPFGWHDFEPKSGRDGSHTISPGSSLSFRHRIFLHADDGDSTTLIRQANQSYSNPPIVRVRAD